MVGRLRSAPALWRQSARLQRCRQRQVPPEQGIFQEHLDYAHWYATRWALRIMDVINKYDPDFIYTDGDSTGPFTGNKTGTGYKSMPCRVSSPITTITRWPLAARWTPSASSSSTPAQRRRQHRREPHSQGHHHRRSVDRRTRAGRLVLPARFRLQLPLAHPLYVGDCLPRRQLRRQHPPPA